MWKRTRNVFRIYVRKVCLAQLVIDFECFCTTPNVSPIFFSISTGIMEIFSVTSLTMAGSLLLLMRMLNQSEIVIGAWYVLNSHVHGWCTLLLFKKNISIMFK
ncbi:hypothetical protein Dsin_012810 [Dipteronia sinensis]|uniref:Uncharacterized protein n=1 Tax=Dipteronia sinensis TaxID=43782 RepID=A0AAE0AJJ4_9ROSI|nr:hypothetical protein Dsin_012810 [Dipteronia sinensis]